MKNSIFLLLVMLLPACATGHKAGGAIGNATGTVLEHGKSNAESQPAARQRPVPAEVKQPARVDQVAPPKKREHNIEED